jgi:hypothetical protein
VTTDQVDATRLTTTFTEAIAAIDARTPVGHLRELYDRLDAAILAAKRELANRLVEKGHAAALGGAGGAAARSPDQAADDVACGDIRPDDELFIRVGLGESATLIAKLSAQRARLEQLVPWRRGREWSPLRASSPRRVPSVEARDLPSAARELAVRLQELDVDVVATIAPPGAGYVQLLRLVQSERGGDATNLVVLPDLERALAPRFERREERRACALTQARRRVDAIVAGHSVAYYAATSMSAADRDVVAPYGQRLLWIVVRRDVKDLKHGRAEIRQIEQWTAVRDLDLDALPCESQVVVVRIGLGGGA